MASRRTWLTKRMIEASSAALSRSVSSSGRFVHHLEGALLAQRANRIGPHAQALLHLALDGLAGGQHRA